MAEVQKGKTDEEAYLICEQAREKAKEEIAKLNGEKYLTRAERIAQMEQYFINKGYLTNK